MSCRLGRSVVRQIGVGTKILPCTVYLEGEYGVSGLFLGVPVKLGAGGVEQIVEIRLTKDEQAELQKSADAVRELTDILAI